MRRIIVHIFLVGAIAYFSACARKVVCPAYHSYFILDVDVTKETFSLFGADSLPKKNWEIEKEKYGIAKDIPYRKKDSDMRIISTNSIYKKIEDPMELFKKAYPISDSLYAADAADGFVQDPMHNEITNVDQMIYLHHFGKYLPQRNDGRQELEEDLKEDPLIPDVEQEGVDKPKKKKRPGWFGRKNKEKETDQTEEEVVEGQQ